MFKNLIFITVLRGLWLPPARAGRFPRKVVRILSPAKLDRLAGAGN
jgi:hypothetical protein